VKDGYLTIPEISKETGIPESTARRYLEQHNHALRTKKSGRGAWLLKEDDLELMRTIRNCYEQKMSVEEVENYLLQSGQPITITVENEREQVITPAAAFMKMAEEMQLLKNEVLASRQQLAAAYEQISNLKRQQEIAHEELVDFKKQQADRSAEQIKAIDSLKSEIQSVSEDLISRLERGQLEREKEQQKGFWQRLVGR